VSRFKIHWTILSEVPFWREMVAVCSLIRDISRLKFFSIKGSVADDYPEVLDTKGETTLLSENGVSNSKLGSRPN
jgi:hypothetical protein